MTTLYTIYQITNIVNNKIYVGAHQTTNVDDGYMGSSKILEAAIAKYGAENFIKEIIHMAKSHEDMYLYERTLVDKEFVGRDDTYNIRIGGKGGFNHIHDNPELHKAALQKAASPEVQAKRIKKYKKWWGNASDDERENCTSSLFRGNVGQTAEQRARANKTHSESIKGKNNPQFGKKWYIDPITEKRRVCRPGDEPEGYILSAGYKTRKVREYERNRIVAKRKKKS